MNIKAVHVMSLVVIDKLFPTLLITTISVNPRMTHSILGPQETGPESSSTPTIFYGMVRTVCAAATVVSSPVLHSSSETWGRLAT